MVKLLGAPIGESPDGVMRFNVNGGSIQVSFVNDKFVTAKKLRTELAGTVLEIVLQHDHSSDTPESLKLLNNHAFTRDETKDLDDLQKHEGRTDLYLRRRTAQNYQIYVRGRPIGESSPLLKSISSGNNLDANSVFDSSSASLERTELNYA